MKAYGKVMLKDITHNFLTLGFAATEKSVFPFFTEFVRECNGYKKDLTTEEYLNCDIPITEFLKMFQGDDYQQSILDALNTEVRKKVYIKEGQDKQREALQRQKANLEQQKLNEQEKMIQLQEKQREN